MASSASSSVQKPLKVSTHISTDTESDIVTTVEIDAPIEDTWKALVSLPEYGQWWVLQFYLHDVYGDYINIIQESIHNDRISITPTSRLHGKDDSPLRVISGKTYEMHTRLTLCHLPYTVKETIYVNAVSDNTYELAWSVTSYPPWMLRTLRVQRLTSGQIGDRDATFYENTDSNHERGTRKDGIRTTTIYETRQHFDGLLAGIVRSSLRGMLVKSFEEMARALKRHVEYELLHRKVDTYKLSKKRSVTS